MKSIDILRQLYLDVVPKVPEALQGEVGDLITQAAKNIRVHGAVHDCTRCLLKDSCTNKVTGEGPINADIMFVGEAPGENEDREGRPFIGPSGEVMDKLLAALDWKREQFYITNVLKCRPPENRKPTDDEIAQCLPHLEEEIAVVQPKVIVCWGSTAAQALIRPDFRITDEEGLWFEDGPILKIAVFHPAYLLRQVPESEEEANIKWKMFNALQRVKEYQESGYTHANPF